ncbi:hypothetical protein A3A21_00815 [Candidatus Jorgensenbacteria bacterium RIFCSPLOWO2_01_FULL_45_25b]|uniref:DNA-directed DNA polymerase n=1 Tax=Candidatus Jorgensenbacteria bacterium RIFCSPLOWO2_01_FULL_45_25b TaxID=1798471 RepID=A0A1F6BUX2_9BACT|nr:MAG: hypothetical protein A3A21_00815 [Candidatus Jorgensenbacteria bacterium RIFCSPLOWO2_01_FULL_45_25b]
MKTLLLIDTNAFIHRAFHALPPLQGPSGEPTGALYGLMSILLKAIKDIQPEYIGAAFDRPEATFRKELFQEYKANRPKAPDELVSQIKGARELLDVLRIRWFECPTFEADDVIGTLVEAFKHQNLHIIILTGDLDALQLVKGEGVVVQTPRKGLGDIVTYDETAVEERFSVLPAQITDYKGLVGDASDNIPGVPGVGPKTAASLLQEFGSVEGIFKKMKEQHPLAKKILSHKDVALFSKKLATINTNVPITATLEELERKEPEEERIEAYLTRMGFESIKRRMGKGGVFQKKTSEADEAPMVKKEPPSHIVVVPHAAFCREHQSLLQTNKMKVAYDWKEILKESREEILPPFFDVKIAAWLLSPDKETTKAAIGRRFLKVLPREEDDESITISLFLILEENIRKEGLEYVFEEIEMPLVPVLAKMELSGIGIRVEALGELKKEADEELKILEEKIYSASGETFNINSPKQMGEVLFEKLKIRGNSKKTATGQHSTREEVLEETKEAHPVIPLLLEYRETFKVASTYIEPLIKLEEHGRIHTHFLQTGTATGRLSSEKPNMQNIPRESRWAVPLRKAFIAGEGKSFLSFDYSQLELRLLAHITKDEELTRAFEEGQDVHRLTASKVFKVPLDKVTNEMRGLGKTLNFGIIYGMGPRALSRAVGSSLKEAQIFIEEYFRNFSAIRLWQEKVKEGARTSGVVSNLNGRKRWFPVGTSHPRFLSEIERMAINMPVQSLGADIIKLAMIQTDRLFQKKRWTKEEASLLLSIHDELLFEVSDDILGEASREIRSCVEGAYPLSVPLRVDVKRGKNWGEME